MGRKGKVEADASRPLEMLQNGLYTGTVLRSDMYRRRVSVRLDGSQAIVDCLYAGGIFSSMFGLQTKFLPQKDTRVAVLYGATPYILACLPSTGGDPASGLGEAMLGTGSPPGSTPFTSLGDPEDPGAEVQPHPQDLLEGELDLTNAFGAGIRLLTTIASLNGGDRAKVETHALNDMVRIISRTFRSYSAFGDYEIYNDGRLNVRFDGTSYPHEAYGVTGFDEPLEEGGPRGCEADPEKAAAETGRWRFSEYVGFLGDFMTRIISDPQAAVGQLYDSATATVDGRSAIRSGKARFHTNADGTMLLQSVAEIALERVCRIPVPVEKKRSDDPEGNVARDFKMLEGKYLRLWEHGKGSGGMHHTCFQLREYARWLSNYHAYARFHQLGKDWDVPKETDIPEPSPTCGEDDKAQANYATEVVDTYATIRIMRDGSIITLNGYGSSIAMAGRDMYVSSARHLFFEAAGDMAFTAGKNIHMKAYGDLNLVSVAGVLSMKARKALRALCEKGVVWLKSDLDASGEPGELGKNGIMLDATRSDVRVGGAGTVSISGKNVVVDAADKVLLSGLRGLRLIARAGIVAAKALAGVELDTLRFQTTATDIALGDKVRIRRGIFAADSVTADVVQAMKAMQAPEKPGAPGTDHEHYNHVSVVGRPLAESADVELGSNDGEFDAAALMDAAALKERLWALGGEGRESAEDLCETYAQQYARMQFSEDYRDLDGDEQSERIYPAPYNAPGSEPWPGSLAQAWKHGGGENLTEPSSDGYQDPPVEVVDFVKRAEKLRVWNGEAG